VQLLNFDIILHPMNWVIVILMVLIFGIALHLVLDFYQVEPGKDSTPVVPVTL
jgi:hypothetical protein